jgi:hypothetical protein
VTVCLSPLTSSSNSHSAGSAYAIRSPRSAPPSTNPSRRRHVTPTRRVNALLDRSSVSNASSGAAHFASGSSNGNSTAPPCSPLSPAHTKLETTASSWGYDPMETDESLDQSLDQSPEDTSDVSAVQLLANLRRPRARRSTVVPTSPLSDCTAGERRDTLVNTPNAPREAESRHRSPLVQLM